MEFTQRASGLAVPKEKPQKPRRVYGASELQDEDRREEARQALNYLWDAMELSNVSRIVLNDKPNMYRKLYDYVGTVLLGDDVPEREIKT